MLVPGDTPPKNVWTGDPPCVVPLKLVARLADRRLAFDRDHLESLLSGDRRQAPVKAPQSFPTPPGTAWQEVMVWVTEFHDHHRGQATAPRADLRGSRV